MKLIAEGKHYASYRFEPGEKRPEVMPQKLPSPTSYPFKTCSRCGEKGVFDYT